MIRAFTNDFELLCQEQGQARAILDAKTGQFWTYAALHEAVLGMSAWLSAQGLRPGGRVFSILPNSIEQFVALLATWRIGADFCPISPLSTTDEALRFIKLCGCDLALIPQRTEEIQAQKIREATAKHVVLPFALNGDLSLFIDKASTGGAGSEHAGRIILFTSGTVSNPKAMLINGDRLWSSARAWAGFHKGLGGDSRFLNVLPMSYLGGLFNLGLIPLAAGGSFVISEAFSGITALRFWRDVRDFGVNTLWLGPTMLRALQALYKPDAEAAQIYKQVRFSFLGMAPATLAEKERFENTFGIPLLENFALSETTFLTSEVQGSALPRSVGSVGRVLPWAELRLTEPDSKEGISEIEVKTPFLFEGYLGPDGTTSLSLTADGFLKTGDLGVFDDGGTLVIRGRSKDIVKKGGYLLVLSELEDAARSHPNVLDVAAIGVPHDFYGETAIVCVQMTKETSTRSELEDVARHITRSLARYKWPGEVVSLAKMPRTESGKVQKRFLIDAVTSRQGIQASVALK